MTDANTASTPQFVVLGSLGQRQGGRCAQEASLVLAEAMDFIAMCGSMMRPVAFHGVEGLEIREQELPPWQEAAMRRACQFANRYFADASRRQFAIETGGEDE